MRLPVVCVLLVIILLLVSGCSSTKPSPSQTPISSTLLPQFTIKTTPVLNVSSTASPSLGKMFVSFIDVGQGDSELIQSPSGKVMLIDAGPRDAGPKVVKYLKNQGINTIDVLVATNPHEDHIGGMSEVLDAFIVNQFIDGGYPNTTSTYKNVLTLIDQKKIPLKTVKNRDTITFDPVVPVTVLNPQSSFSGDINQNSVVLKITYGERSFLFTGDAGEPIEDCYAVNAGRIDVLKVADHGSSTSTGSPFLSIIKPIAGIIEVGAGNSDGDPAESTLQRLRESGIGVYRTDQLGTITITTDGIYELHFTMEKLNVPTFIPTTSTVTTTS